VVIGIIACISLAKNNIVLETIIIVQYMPQPLLIGLAGRMGSGKSILTRLLTHMERRAAITQFYESSDATYDLVLRGWSTPQERLDAVL